jgi:hypothetical protein
VIVPMLVVRRKVLVPDNRVVALPAAAPQLPISTSQTAAPIYQAPIYQAPVYQTPVYQAPAPAAYGQAIIAGRDNRYYVMVPSNAPVPMNGGTVAQVNSYISYFPVW